MLCVSQYQIVTKYNAHWNQKQIKLYFIASDCQTVTIRFGELLYTKWLVCLGLVFQLLFQLLCVRMLHRACEWVCCEIHSLSLISWLDSIHLGLLLGFLLSHCWLWIIFSCFCLRHHVYGSRVITEFRVLIKMNFHIISRPLPFTITMRPIERTETSIIIRISDRILTWMKLWSLPYASLWSSKWRFLRAETLFFACSI